MPQKKGVNNLFSQDEHPRKPSLEALGKLKTPFGDGGTITAGNSSRINDGAPALIIASEEAAEKYDLTPIARVIAGSTAGVAPSVMGLGPIYAVRKLCTKIGAPHLISV